MRLSERKTPTQLLLNTPKIQIFAISAIIFSAIASAVALATPAFELNERQYTPCPGSGTAQCCDFEVLGLADLDCTNPPHDPTSPDDFNTICAAVGKIDMCCLLPVLDHAIICGTP
ncbi:magnaporin [Mycena latifolia]|nr:magnaporin [Mycena latifolia]